MILFVPYIASSTNVALRANKHQNNREVKAAAWACKAAIQNVDIEIPITGRVDLVFRPRLGKGDRMRDTSNYSISMKHIEDGLVAAGLLPDDRGQYVRRVILDPPEVDRKAESGTWVELIPVEVTA